MGTDHSAQTIASDSAAIAAGVEAAVAATQGAQTTSHAFYVQHGAELLPGHADTAGSSGQPATNGIAGPSNASTAQFQAAAQAAIDATLPTHQLGVYNTTPDRGEPS
jgi:hypothetical protein